MRPRSTRLPRTTATCRVRATTRPICRPRNERPTERGERPEHVELSADLSGERGIRGQRKPHAVQSPEFSHRKHGARIALLVPGRHVVDARGKQEAGRFGPIGTKPNLRCPRNGKRTGVDSPPRSCPGHWKPRLREGRTGRPPARIPANEGVRGHSSRAVRVPAGKLGAHGLLRDLYVMDSHRRSLPTRCLAFARLLLRTSFASIGLLLS